jgi:hypothetical protein
VSGSRVIDNAGRVRLTGKLVPEGTQAEPVRVDSVGVTFKNVTTNEWHPLELDLNAGVNILYAKDDPVP